MSKITKTQMALSLLRGAGSKGVTGSEFLEHGCGTRYGARIQELRGLGHKIPARPLRPGLYLYTLVFDVERDLRPSRPPEVALDADAPPPASRGGEQPPLQGHRAGSLTSSPQTLFEPDSGRQWGGYDYDPEEDAA